MTRGYIVTRNGVPCTLMNLSVPHLPRIRNICVPSEIPPVPHIFRRLQWGLAALKRTGKASIILRRSIHAEFIRKKFSRLESLFTTGNYTLSNYPEESEKITWIVLSGLTVAKCDE
jgi:hypothetical protein